MENELWNIFLKTQAVSKFNANPQCITVKTHENTTTFAK
jgi:hypothetical protein